MGKNQSKINREELNKNINSIDLLEKIKSKYIIEQIFDFIDEIVKFKLFIYSKKYQEKFNLLLFEYQYYYIIKNEINLLDYLYFSKIAHPETIKNIKDDLFNNIEQECISKYIQNFSRNSKYIERYRNKLKKIYICSLLFKAFSKAGLLEQYIIYVNIDEIKKYNLKKKCSLIFDNLHKSNIKYNSIAITTWHYKDIDYLKKFNINFSLVKTLDIISFSNPKHNYDYYLKSIFSLNDIQNHLNTLKISLNKFNVVNKDSMLGLNYLKALEVLYIKNISFEQFNPFFLKLKGLKELYLISSNFVNFDDCCSNLKKIELKNSSINRPKILIQLPNLEYLRVDKHTFNKENPQLYFDFKSLNKLTEFYGNYNNIIYIINPLEKVGLEFDYKEKEYQNGIIKKILDMNSLKKIEITDFNLDMLSEIEGVNPSIAELVFNTRYIYNFYNIKNKFPNLSKLYISYDYYTIELKMKENSNSKIHISNEKSLKIYFEPIENLEKIRVFWRDNIEINSLPFFQENFLGIFESLIIFRFNLGEVSINIILRLFKNIDNMPNLKEFEFTCRCHEIKLEEYNKCIIKLLSLNLDSIKFKADPRFYNKDKYSFEELKKIYPSLKLKNYKHFDIYKFGVEKEEPRIIIL